MRLSLALIFFEIFKALIIFKLCPEVEIANIVSPFFAIASICLEKIYSKPKSFPIAVNADVSVANEIAEIAFLLNLNLTVSSVAKC